MYFEKFKKVFEENFAKLLKDERGEISLTGLMLTALGIIIVAFIFVPQLRTLATNIMLQMGEWWNTKISPVIFPAS